MAKARMDRMCMVRASAPDHAGRTPRIGGGIHAGDADLLPPRPRTVAKQAAAGEAGDRTSARDSMSFLHPCSDSGRDGDDVGQHHIVDHDEQPQEVAQTWKPSSSSQYLPARGDIRSSSTPGGEGSGWPAPVRAEVRARGGEKEDSTVGNVARCRNTMQALVVDVVEVETCSTAELHAHAQHRRGHPRRRIHRPSTCAHRRERRKGRLVALKTTAPRLLTVRKGSPCLYL